MHVAIIDYTLGNLRSVYNAFAFLGAEPCIVHRPDELRQAGMIVLPGVGAFKSGMDALRRHGWIPELEEQVLRRRKPFLGICLGMQLLAEWGYEDGEHHGLGWIQGCAEPMDGAPGFSIPHIGWNDVEFPGHSKMGEALQGAGTFYFAHSYVLRIPRGRYTMGWSRHAAPFAASIEVDNIWGTQFHPEKSQKAGLAVLKAFLGD